MSLKKAVVAIPVGAVLVAASLAPVTTAMSVQKRHHTQKHSRKHSRVHRAVVTSGNINCTGTQSSNVPYDLTVPAGKTCTVKAGVAIGHDIYVDKGSTLIDQGASVGYDINATAGPAGIGITAPSGSPGSVGHDIDVTGTSSTGPGTVDHGSSYICNTQVGDTINVQSSTSKAGDWIIGDRDEDCSTGANLVGFNLYAENNKDRVDVSDNMQGTPPYAGGIGNNLYVLDNTVTSTSPIVESNFIGDMAYCQSGTKMDGDGTHNVVGGTNSGCP